MSDTPPDDRSRANHASSKPGMAAEIFGGLLLIFSVCMLGFGAIGLVRVLHDDVFTRHGRLDTAGDSFEVSMFFVIGILSGAFAIRWLRTCDKK